MQRVNVRVVQARDGLRLALEPLLEIGVRGNMLGEDFDGDGTVESRISGFVHLAHAPRPDGREDLEMAERGARAKRHRLLGVLHAAIRAGMPRPGGLDCEGAERRAGLERHRSVWSQPIIGRSRRTAVGSALRMPRSSRITTNWSHWTTFTPQDGEALRDSPHGARTRPQGRRKQIGRGPARLTGKTACEGIGVRPHLKPHPLVASRCHVEGSVTRVCSTYLDPRAVASAAASSARAPARML